MNLKRIMLLTSMALAVVAVAAPAAQGQWTKNHVALTQHETLTVHGTASFGIAGVGSFGCTVHGTLTLAPGSTGTVTNFQPTTETCAGTGALAGCELIHDTSSFGVAHANTGASPTITLTNVTILNVYETESCAVPSIPGSHLEFGTVTLDPDPSGSHKTLSALTVTGTDGTVGAVASGTLNVTPSGVYGLST